MNQSGKMYSYFLSDYINTIVDKDKRKLKDLSKGEIAQLIILILGVSFVFVTTIFYQLGKTSFHFWLELIAIICLYIVIGTIIILSDEKWKRKRKTWSFENGCWQVKIVIIFYRR